MLSLQDFAARCAKHIKEGQPFIAYRHAGGVGFLRLDGGAVTEYKVRYRYRDNAGNTKTATQTTTDPARLKFLIQGSCAEVIGQKTVHKLPAKATVTGFRKAIQKMQKDPHTRYSLRVVEYDGFGWSADNDVVSLIEVEL